MLSAIFTFTSCKEDKCEIDTTLTGETSEVTRIADNHHRGYTDIVIDASPSEVWEVLTDFENMPSWSTSLQDIRGELANGSMVEVDFLLQGTVSTSTRTLIYEEGVLYGWSEPTSGLFAGFVDNHIYKVEMISECQTRFVQSDEFELVGENMNFTSEMLANAVVPLYQEFNRGLKAQVEN